jgi:hypothetical protein
MKLLKKLDEFIFSKLDTLKTSEQYNKVEAAYSELDDDYQMIARYGIIAVLFLVPLIILMILTFSNSSLREEIAQKEELIKTGNEIIARDGLIRRAERLHLGQGPISTQATFETRLSQLAGSAGSETENLSVIKFEKIDQAGNIVQALIDVQFKQQTNKQVFSLVSTMKSMLKGKIDSLTIKKNKENELLDGIIRLAYYWKSDFSEEGESENFDE